MGKLFVTLFARPTVRPPERRSRAGSYGRAFTPALKTTLLWLLHPDPSLRSGQARTSARN